MAKERGRRKQKARWQLADKPRAGRFSAQQAAARLAPPSSSPSAKVAEPPDSDESGVQDNSRQDTQNRLVEGVTVAWMCAAITSLVAGLLGLPLRYLALKVWHSPGLTMGSGIGLLGGILAGFISLMMIPMVYRLRPVAPPLAITIGVCIAAVLPWLGIFIR